MPDVFKAQLHRAVTNEEKVVRRRTKEQSVGRHQLCTGTL